MSLSREFDIGSSIDLNARTVDLAFSSELPYMRWFGWEILDHSSGSVDLSRLQDKRHPLLVNHCTEDQVGVIESASIDADKVGRATVRFGRGEYASEIFQDVQDGIRTLVSVGYEIEELEADDPEQKGEDGAPLKRKLSWQEFQTEMRALHGEDCFERKHETRDARSDAPTFRVTKWTPFEISIVSIPADPSVGVGRAAGADADNANAIQSAPVVNQPQIETERKSNMSDIELQEKLEAARKTGASAESQRVADLLAVADQYKAHGAGEMVAEFIRGQKSVAEFNEAILKRMTEKFSDGGSLADVVGTKELKRYSLAKAIAAQAERNWKEAGLEREISEEIARRTGQSPAGFYLPMETALSRAFNIATAGTADNTIQTSVLGNEFVDVLRNALVLNRLGVRVLSGLTSNIAIPRKTAPSTVANYTEVAAVTASNPTTTQITLSPKRISAQVNYSKQSVIQASLDVEMMLRDDILSGVAVQIENQAITGSGSAPNVRGLLNFSGIGSVVGSTNGAQINWGHIVDLESACANANSEPDAKAGYLVNTKSRGWLKKTQYATNLPFIWQNGEQPLNGYRALVTNNVPSNLTKGTSSGVCSAVAFSSDWSDMILGLFGGLDIVVDPYTQAGTASLLITANQFIDVACRQPASFALMNDALTA